MGQREWRHDPSNVATFITGVGVLSLGLLIEGWRRLRDTTLAAPILWGCATSVVCIVAGLLNDPFVDYAAAVFFISPTLALLGAKRPQNGAWQFIVLTLVGVLLLPALQGIAYGDTRPHVHTLFRWLIAAHIVIGTVNYLPTRFAGPALVFGAAQVCAAFRFFPGIAPTGEYSEFSIQFATPVLAGSTGLFVALMWVNQIPPRTADGPLGLARLWLDFRDAYGLVWGLRIAERLNASAQKHGWPVEFAWGGMLVKTDDGMLDADVQHRVERELRSHLRRFVSHDWIARRLHEPPA